MRPPTDTPGAADAAPWEAVALEKLTRVLGPNEGAKTFNDVMGEIGLSRLATADDLLRFADHLGHREGFVRALAAVLRTHALLRGAK